MHGALFVLVVILNNFGTMDLAGKYFLVYLAGAAGIWKGAPLGIALGLPAFLTGLLNALGSITVVLLLFFSGDSLRQWVQNKYGSKKVEKRKNKFLEYTNRFGVWVIGIFVPGLLGPIPAILLGLVLIKSKLKFLLLLITGIILWSFVLAYFFTPIFNLISNLKN